MGQLLDLRLDCLYAMCSLCKKTSWAPHAGLLDSAIKAMSVANPAGLQCRNRGYVVCRNCFVSENCINRGQNQLRSPVHPTGRLPKQLERRSKSVAAAIILREVPDTA